MRKSLIVSTFMTVISKMIVFATTLLKDYKFVFLACILACSVALSIFGLNANQPHLSQAASFSTTQSISKKRDKPKKASEARMKALRILGKDQYILKFVSHPKVIEYFQKQWQKIDEENIKIAILLQDISKKFPFDKQINFQKNYYNAVVDRIKHPISSQEIIFPFLYCGIGSFKSIENGDLKKIQHFQIGLFKSYISRLIIGSWSGGLGGVEQDLRVFCCNSSEFLFSDSIGPFLNQLSEMELEISDIFSGYDLYEDEEKFSSKQSRVLRKIFDSYESLNSSAGGEIDESNSEIDQFDNEDSSLLDMEKIKVVSEASEVKIKKIFEELSEELLDPSLSEVEIERIFEELSEELSDPSLEALKAFEAASRNSRIFLDKNGFSQNRIIKLFFEVIMEEFTEE